VFEEESTLKSVLNKCLTKDIPLDNFLFRLADQAYDNWIDYQGNKKALFYL
jgi:hypothetical protein